MSKFSVFAVAAMFAATTHLSAATPEAAMNAIAVPGADGYGYCDYAKAYATPIFKKFEEFAKKLLDVMKDTPGGVDIKKYEAFEELCKREGFGSDNYQSGAFSMAIGNFIEKTVKAAMDGGEPNIDFNDLSLVFGYSFKKSVSKEGISKLAKEYAGLYAGDVKETIEELLKKVAVADFAHGGATGFALSFKLDADDLEDMPFDKTPVLALALLADGKVMLFGLEKDVKAAVERANAGTKAEPSAELKKLLDSSIGGTPFARRDGYGANVIPKFFRDKMAELEDDMKDFPISGVVPAIKAAKVLQGLRFTSAYGDKLDFSINFVLDNAESAASLKDLIQINVLGMAKMGLYQVTGKNTAFAESLAAVVDANSTSINFSITAADLDSFLDFIKKNFEAPAFAPFFMDEDDDDDD